jgi:hypothetical protein
MGGSRGGDISVEFSIETLANTGNIPSGTEIYQSVPEMYNRYRISMGWYRTSTNQYRSYTLTNPREEHSWTKLEIEK